jgi:hypothetical protein
MKRRLGLYTAVWAALLILFNVIALVLTGWEGQEKYTSSFWIGYAFTTLMFIGQFICAVVAIKADNAQKMFYNISLIKTSYIGLVVSFVIGGLCMLISPLPYWLSTVVCAIVLVSNVITVIKATVAVTEIERVDDKVKTQTFFVKSLTVDADTLVASAKSDVAKTECRKVYEAIRYSDPMSNDALASVEGQIAVRFAELSDAVKADDADRITELANEVCILINNRNQKCKIFK